VSSLRPVRRTLLRDEAYELIRRAIVEGDLAPGAQLRDADLATELGLSRAPVRQALTRLVAEGLAESKPQSYTRVAPVVGDHVRDALELVRALRELAVRAGIPALTDDDIGEMRAAHARFAAAVEAGDIPGAIAADDQVHAIPVRACGNRAIADTLDRYTPLLRRLEHARFNEDTAHRTMRRHQELIAAVAAGDAERAAGVTRDIWSELETELGPGGSRVQHGERVDLDQQR
jgi:DNA-binding GntR family transcriptional regulator